MPPSGQQRFPVLNEPYHPGWHTYADRQGVTVWPTNVVMRGVLVPAGVSHLEMRFEPFFSSWPAGLCVLAGLTVAGVGWYACARVDGAAGRRWRA